MYFVCISFLTAHVSRTFFATFVLLKYTYTYIYPGTHTECQYSLVTFGIPVQSLPITHRGDIKTVNHNKWLLRQQVRENVLKKTGNFSGIDTPGRNDILLGRGKPFHEHPGNVKMRHLVSIYAATYRNAPNGEKSTVAEKVLQVLKNNQSNHFLKRDEDGWWMEVPDDEARERIAQVFRTARSSKTKAREERRQRKSTTVLATTAGSYDDDRHGLTNDDKNVNSNSSNNSNNNNDTNQIYQQMQQKRIKIDNENNTNNNMFLDYESFPTNNHNNDNNNTCTNDFCSFFW